jgi:DHA1 family bicyclomycin/chloramphenicol resistance-like MFS transporter
MLGLLKNGKFVKLVIGSGLIYGGLFSYISASSFVFQNYFHMSVSSFGFLYAVNGIGIAIGSAVPGILATKVSETRQIHVVLTTTLLSALALTISWFVFNNLITAIGLVLLIVLQFGMLFTLTTSVIMNLSMKNSGGISALLGLSQNAIGGVMSPLVGIMGSQTYLPMAVSITVCIGISLWLFTQIKPSPST